MIQSISTERLTAYIALGSNLDNPLAQVTTAVEEIDRLPGCAVIGQSSWYRTAPVGPAGQSDYINGVIAVATSLPASKLLAALNAIENRHGRVRNERWGARTLDLDILLYGQQVIDTPRLQIPHPRMGERGFVLFPLFELAPNLIIPDGISLAGLLENISSEGIVRLTVGEICGSTG